MAASVLRLIGGALVVAGVATLAVAAPEMVQRVRAHTTSAPTVQWAARVLADDAFNYRGDPVTIETTRDEGGPVVAVSWRGATEILPVTGLDETRLPRLLRHKEWLRVLEMAPVSGDQSAPEALAAGAESSLVVVGRAPAEGYDPATWGKVIDKQWRYSFLRLTESGAIERSAGTADEIAPDTWQAAAAFAVSPELAKSSAVATTMRTLHPGKAPANDSFGKLGWTWTAAGLAIMGIVVGGMLFAGSFLGRSGHPNDE